VDLRGADSLGLSGFPRGDKVQIHRGKIGIDATVPLEMKKQFERKKIPKESNIDFSRGF
jgi:hypothetical protein